MYEIKEDYKCINGSMAETFTRDVSVEDAELQAEAGTTGFRGGERAAGGRTYLRIENIGGADFFAKALKDNSGVEIALSGDSSLMALIKVLDFASRVLTEQAAEVND